MRESAESGGVKILPREEHTISRKQFTPGTLDVLYRLQEAGYLAYIAGGGVRDLLVGRNPKDFDIATNARPEQVKRLFHRCRLIGRRFRLAHVYARGDIIEVSTFRATLEDNEDKSRFHERSEEGMILRDNIYGTPEQDARRRDFTVNALFYNIADFSIIDYVGGLADIRDRLIRSIGDPETRFIEDPVRMIRAVRFAASLGFEIEPVAAEALLRNAERIAQASPARMFEEVQKLFFCGNAKDILQHLERFGLLQHILPELADSLHDDGDRRWLERVMRQLDTWRLHGIKVTPELLFALLFGSIHEKRIHQLTQDGMNMFEASEAAVTDHLVTLSKRVLVPKAIGRHIAQLMAVQPYFTSSKKSKHERFARRPCFHDAYIYFKMRSRFLDIHQDEIHYWDAFIRGDGG